MAETRSSLFAYTALFRDVLPKTLELAEHLQADLTQLETWLVGLASTLLALAVVSPDRARTATGGSYGTTAVLLLVTIAAGVLARLLGGWSTATMISSANRLHAEICGMEAGLREAKLPRELSEGWDEAEIVRRLQADLDVNYAFLLEHQVPLEKCREEYRIQYGMWQRYEKERLDKLKTAVANSLGLTKSEADRAFVSATDEQMKGRWRIAMAARIVAYIAAGLLLAAGLAFIGAMFLIARGMWRL
jgi:hypothetical protein